MTTKGEPHADIEEPWVSSLCNAEQNGAGKRSVVRLYAENSRSSLEGGNFVDADGMFFHRCWWSGLWTWARMKLDGG